jgi:hypothetical protein
MREKKKTRRRQHIHELVNTYNTYRSDCWCYMTMSELWAMKCITARDTLMRLPDG